MWFRETRVDRWKEGSVVVFNVGVEPKTPPSGSSTVAFRVLVWLFEAAAASH